MFYLTKAHSFFFSHSASTSLLILGEKMYRPLLLFSIVLVTVSAIKSKRGLFRQRSPVFTPAGRLVEHFTLHGNWCGITDFENVDSTAPAIDSLDSLCRKLYRCYQRHGALNCRCDINILKAIDRRGTRLNASSVAVATFYLRSPCVTPQIVQCPTSCDKRCQKEKKIKCRKTDEPGISEACVLGYMMTTKILDVNLPLSCPRSFLSKHVRSGHDRKNQNPAKKN